MSTIQPGDIRFDKNYGIVFYVIKKEQNNVQIINSLLYSSDVNDEECNNSELIKHYDDIKKGVMEFIITYYNI